MNDSAHTGSLLDLMFVFATRTQSSAIVTNLWAMVCVART